MWKWVLWLLRWAVRSGRRLVARALSLLLWPVSRLRRRRIMQASAVATVPSVPVTSVLGTALLSQVPWARLCLCLYLGWAWCWDSQPTRGGRPWMFLRTLGLWRHFREYFPLRLITTASAPLQANKRYIFAIHPHGIWSVGTWGTFLGLHPELRHLNVRVVTISANFRVPLWRDFCMGVGLADASRESIHRMLSKNISVGIVVGGAAEALDARPGSNDLTLQRRLGFVRLALEHGASLVPVYNFGENDIYRQLVSNPPGSWVRALQEFMMKWLGYSLPLILGRWSTLGVLPYRRPVTTVIGKPLQMPYIPHPTATQLLEAHERYTKALTDMFAEYRDVLKPEDADMHIVDRLRKKDLKKLQQLDDIASKL